MKKKVLIILLVVFGLLLAGAIGFGIYLNTNFSTMIFEKGLDKLYTLSNSTLTKANMFDYENKMFLFDSRVIRSARRRCGTRCWTVRPGSPPHGASRSSDPARCSGRSRRV